MAVGCEDCRYANWEMKFFPDGPVKVMPDEFPKDPYSVQFDVYCAKHNKFFLETEISGICPDGVYGENNYHEVCKEFYRQRKEYLEQLKKEYYNKHAFKS